MTEQSAYRPLEGRAFLITGAGHGIGRATAHRLTSLGAIVGVNDLREAFVAEAVAALEAEGGHPVGIVKDVSTRDGNARGGAGIVCQNRAAGWIGEQCRLGSVSTPWRRLHRKPWIACLELASSP